MTYTEEFTPEEDQEFEEEVEYPTAFGVTFTPKVSGIAIGALGLLTAGYLLMNFGLPAFSELNELKDQEADKQAQVEARQSGKLDQEQVSLEAELKRVELTKQQVLSLYAQPSTLNTILLDLNRFVNARNVTMNSFQPAGATNVVNDGSLGAGANGKLKRQSYSLNITGTYKDVQAFLRDIERLQPLIVVRNLTASPQRDDEEGKLPVTLIEDPDQEVYAIPNPETPATLNAQFTLDVILAN
ncbi:MAG: pilus assembly protein [Microcystaceae cyanobacterium]